MRTREAFGILHVSDAATEKEVLEAFDSMAKSAHPDTGGTNDQMRDLLEARKVAIERVRRKGLPAKYERPITDLVAAEVAKHLDRVNPVGALAERLESASVDRSRRRDSGRRVSTFSGVSGVLLVAITLIASKVVPAVREVPVVGFLVSGLLVLLALAYLITSSSDARASHRISMLEARLADKETCLRVIEECFGPCHLQVGEKLGSGNIAFQVRFTRSFYRVRKGESAWSARLRWMRQNLVRRTEVEMLGRYLGWDVLAAAVLGAGVRHGILARVETTSESGAFEISYQVQPPRSAEDSV